jgi:hypothetical protein
MSCVLLGKLTEMILAALTGGAGSPRKFFPQTVSVILQVFGGQRWSKLITFARMNKTSWK